MPAGLTFRECRSLAAAVPRTREAGRARTAVRPQALGTRWSRPPFALLIHLADQEGRLIGASAGAFAIIEPPIARAAEWTASQPVRVRRLSRLVRAWPFVTPSVPVLLALLVIVSAIHFLRPRPLVAVAVLAAGFAVTCAEMIVAASRMSWSLGRLLRTGRTDGEILADELQSHFWIVAFCHADAPEGADVLFRAASGRAAALTGGKLRADPAFGSGIVAVEPGRVTDPRVGESLSGLGSVRPVGDTGWFTIGGTHERFRRPDQDAVRPLGGIRLMLATTALVLVALAQGVSWFEREACPDGGCGTRPVTFSQALVWTLEHAIGRFPGPVTWQSQVFGAAFLIVAPLMAACIVLALVWRRRYQNARRRIMYEAIERMAEQPTVAILAVNETECAAVIDAFRARVPALRPIVERVGDHAVHALGTIGGARVVLAQSEQGTVGTGSMPWTARNLVDELRPGLLVLTGICYGLRSRELDDGDQEIGDVVVATQLRPLDHRKVGARPDGSRHEVNRGPRPETPSWLLSQARALALGRRPPVHFGPVLSLSTLVDHRDERQRLRALEEEAIAGEMESAGLYAAAAAAKRDSVLVKGISDWASGKSDRHQPLAARHAADFVADLIAQIYPAER